MTHEQDIFYTTDHLSIEDKKNLLGDTKALCYHWHVDILDCSKSWSRERINMSFDDALSKLKANSHFVVIHRRGFIEHKGKERDLFNMSEWCLEIGFTTMETPSYYLWINCEPEHIEYIKTRYKLLELKN